MRPTIQMLEPDLIASILAEAKRIMAEIGMDIRGPKMRQRLIDAGLPTDTNGRVLFPTEIVDRAIETAPKSFTLYNRDGQPHAEIGGWNVHFIPGSSGLKIMDHRTGETRLADSKDFIEYARLCDGLPHIPYLATAFSTNKDIEPQVSDAWRLYMVLTTTKKPVVSGAFGEHGVPLMAEMMQLFRRDRAELIAKPMSIFTITATGNFRFGEDSFRTRTDHERDICIRQHASESAQRRYRHHGVAYPIRATHDDAPDTFSLHTTHSKTISTKSLAARPQPRSAVANRVHR